MKKTTKNLLSITDVKSWKHPLYNEYKLPPILDGLNIGLWEYNCKTNALNYSVEAMRVFGYDDNNLEFSEIDREKQIHPEDFNNVQEKLNSHLNNQTDYYKSEHRQLSKSGVYKWVLDYGKVIERDKSGNPIRATGTITDITIRKGQELDLSKNLDTITKQNKILENIARIASHNLKEYAGNFESLLGFYDEKEIDKNEVILHLKTVSKSLTKTITSLSHIISKQNIENLHRENLNLYDYIENAKNLFKAELTNNKTIINNNVDKDIYLYSNGAYLESIIQNLISNAIKYAHPDRSLVMEVNSNMQEDGLLTITLTDNGQGIDLNKYGKDVFKLYRTFHGNENAEGIGLYITKNQLEELGATIAVNSEVNVGTTFTITTTNAIKIPAKS